MEADTKKNTRKSTRPKESPSIGDASSPPVQSDKRPKSRLGIVAAITLAAAALFTGNHFLSSSTVDDISEQKKTELVENFKGVVAELPAVDLTDPEERQKAIVALDLPKQQAEKIMSEADAGKIKLGWLTVWDNYAEDGDVVQVYANGLTRTIPIWNTPTTIVVPYTTNAMITITGTHDGGGGITAAAQTPSGPVYFPPLVVGQTIQLPVR